MQDMWDEPGCRGSWAFGPNRGFPFDKALAKEITEAWAAGV
jgi:hypothetical protein